MINFTNKQWVQIKPKMVFTGSLSHKEWGHIHILLGEMTVELIKQMPDILGGGS